MITRFYPYALTLKAPLLLTALEGDPNSVHSLGFIPGSAIRGAVASRLEPDIDPQRFRQCILSGQVCYLNAYPTVRDQRALPIPVSFRQDKYGDTTHDLAFYSGQPELEDAWPDEQLKGVEIQFLNVDQASFVPALATVDSRVHQQRDRSAGRAYTYRDPQQPDVEEARGTIFTYEALEAGQQFQGLIAISGQAQNETDALWQQIKSVLGERLSLGRSRNARYGGAATITYGDSSRSYETAGSTRTIRKDLQKGVLFCIFLTSDYVGRSSESGQCDPTFFKQDITKRLGENRAEVLRTRWAFRPVGGFNRKWGLQLPQTLALRAGSLLVLKAKVGIPYADLSAIEQTGLGERRTEGFGRVVFLEAPEKQHTIPEAEPARPLERPEKPDHPLINTMQKRIIMEALAHRITEIAAKLTRDTEQIPSPSLLGRLRVPLRKGTAESLDTLRAWLSENGTHSLRRPAMNQLDDCRIDQKRTPLSQWIRERVNASNVASDLKQILETQRVIRRAYIQSREAAERVLDKDTALQLSIRLRLIDEVLALLARQKRLASRGGNHAND